jgi:hypothetical protein
VLVTRNQRQRLVNLIRYYRLPHKGWSTQITSVALAWTKSGRVLGSEYHKDESGQDSFLVDADLHDLRALKRTGGRWATLLELPVLSLLRVAEQAEEAYKKGLKRVWLREPRREETWAAKELAYHRQTVKNQASAEKIIRHMPGFATLDAHYLLSDFDQGDYFFLGGSGLSLTLKPRVPHRVGQFDWYIPLDKEKPHFGGETLLKCAAQLNNWIKPFAWLGDWKQAAPRRIIKTSLYGDQFFSPEGSLNTPRTLWLKKWLQGIPHAQLTLWRSDRTWIDLAIGSAENRALIFSAPFFPKSDKERLAHPLDSLKRDEAKNGVVVNARGIPT